MKHILDKIKSVKLCLMAHPDNTEGSEFADRIVDLESMELELRATASNWTILISEHDLPKENKYALYHVVTRDPIYVGGTYQGVEEYWGNDAGKAKWWMENVLEYTPVTPAMRVSPQAKTSDLEVVALHLEPELVNGQLRLIMTTADGEKYVFSERTMCPEGGQSQYICKKSEDWYFNPANKSKK